MYEYRSACFIVKGKSRGEPIDEVDEFVNQWAREGWEFVNLSISVTTIAMTAVVMLRRKRG